MRPYRNTISHRQYGQSSSGRTTAAKHQVAIFGVPLKQSSPCKELDNSALSAVGDHVDRHRFNDATDPWADFHTARDRARQGPCVRQPGGLYHWWLISQVLSSGPLAPARKSLSCDMWRITPAGGSGWKRSLALIYCWQATGRPTPPVPKSPLRVVMWPARGMDQRNRLISRH